MYFVSKSQSLELTQHHLFLLGGLVVGAGLEDDDPVTHCNRVGKALELDGPLLQGSDPRAFFSKFSQVVLAIVQRQLWRRVFLPCFLLFF